MKVINSIMDLEEKKYRHEYKYLCSDQELELIKGRINNLLKIDPHVKKENKYLIRSLYFDDYENNCYYENEDGVDPREKYRIRIYNNDDSRISLEIKRKVRGKTNKEQILITRKIVEAFLDNSIKYDVSYDKILKRLYLLNKQNLMKPVIIVEYERIPYIYKNGNVRITIDQNICSSRNLNMFFEDTIHKRPINASGYHILEVKFDEFLPDFIYTNLQLDNLQQTAFSKYYLCRKFSL